MEQGTAVTREGGVKAGRGMNIEVINGSDTSHWYCKSSNYARSVNIGRQLCSLELYFA